MRNAEVTAGVIWRQGRFLAALRPQGKPRACFWEFLVGKRERGETIEEALVRELDEELGITCGRLLPWTTLEHAYPDLRVTLHFIHVLDFSGEPEARNGQELRWITPGEAAGMNFLPAERTLIRSRNDAQTVRHADGSR